MKAQHVFALLGVLGLGTMLMVVGLRLTEQGNSFTLGLVAGLSASLPASLVAHYLSEWSMSAADQARPQVQPPAYPPVIIVGGQPQRPMPPAPDFPPRYGQQELNTAPNLKVVG
jgi:hypothetical protein